MSSPSQFKDMRVVVNEKVPMRDGIRIATTIFLPLGDGPFPVVLVRTAYNRMGFNGADFAQRGMALVVQDTRGRYGSEGEYYPFTAETNDGLDTLDWIAAQTWCNGHIGMFGDSYLAATQLAVMAPGHANLTAVNPRFMAGDLWQHGYFFDGVFTLALTFSWLCLEVGSRSSEASILPAFDVQGLLRQLPLLTIDEKMGCGVVPAYRDYVSHETRDKFWQDQSYRATLNQNTVPALLTCGWYDYYAGETFLNYEALCQASPELAAKHRVIIGPWMHGINGTSQLGELDFGPESLQENDSTTRWLECMLKGGEPGDFQEAPIRIFIMGENKWRDEWEWPLARTQFTPYYLHSEGGFSRSQPGTEPTDNYIYDPADPVPTLGGNHSVGPYNPGLYELALPGPYNQAPTEARDDVLVYTSDVLPEDTEVTGPVIMKLFAATSARDTDWVVRLCDVYPDGRSINICEGVIRARFQERQWDRPKLLEPGQVYEYTIDLQAISNLFKKGHRLRLQITSSNFPLWDRNLNTGESVATGVEIQIAEQTIYHDAEHPSHLILPIIPRWYVECSR